LREASRVEDHDAAVVSLSAAVLPVEFKVVVAVVCDGRASLERTVFEQLWVGCGDDVVAAVTETLRRSRPAAFRRAAVSRDRRPGPAQPFATTASTTGASGESGYIEVKQRVAGVNPHIAVSAVRRRRSARRASIFDSKEPTDPRLCSHVI
jgi:hypothetical protein